MSAQEQNTQLQAALDSAGRGWHVFPVVIGQKKSHKRAEFSGGRRWGATKDREEIAADWARWPDANVGLSGKYDASMSTASIASRMRSVNRGQLSPMIAVVDVLSTFLRNRAGKVQAKAIDEMMARAINDPDFAAALLRKHNPADEAAMKRAFLGKFGVRVPTVANILAGDDSDEADPFAQMLGAAQ